MPPERASRILASRNLGLAQLEEGKLKEARSSFARLAELVPDEPLPYANGAVAALRENDLAAADTLLARGERAGGGKPPAELLAIRAALEEARNRPEAARAALAAAAERDPKHLESRWRFVRSADIAPNPTPQLLETRRKLLQEIVVASPANLPARLKLLLTQLEAGNATGSRESLADVERLLADAEAKPKQFLSEARELLGKGDLKQASIKARILENLLRVTSRYQQSLSELFTNVTGVPLESFSPALEASLRPQPGAAVKVTLVESPLSAEDPAATLRRVDLKNAGKPELYAIPAPYEAAAFLDFDLDGDLDVYLYGASQPDRLLRNNLDGSFADVTVSTGDAAFRSRRAVVSDLDRDGDLDLVCVTEGGEVVLRDNLRQGRFRSLPLNVHGAADLSVEDVDGDGWPDVAVAAKMGVVLLRNKRGTGFGREELKPGDTRLALLADLDNDGFPDLVLSQADGLSFLRNSGNGFTPWPLIAKPVAAAERLLALDADGDGDLDLVLARGGKVSALRNDGGNANSWLTVVVEGLPTGSGKVNKAGVGSVVEVKAGDLYVARTVGLTPTHFGLGSRSRADVVRCVFTNGIPQNLLDQRARAVVKEVQQLKGSCPFVYAFNGQTLDWSFVSDALGRAPIGLLYDGVHLAGADPREWLLVDGDLLKPTGDGELLFDYTEELWEAAYLDEATLMAVDHPEGTLVVPNERTIPAPLERKLFTVANPRPPRAAFSTVKGRREDVLERLLRRDQRRVDPGPETHYQGVRDPHDLELDLGPVAEGDRVVLFLDGWIFYGDTSINVSMSQRQDVRQVPPSLEVPDGKGGWRMAMESFGFPSGKTKTMPVELTGLLNANDPRVRIRTTMAIFWDQAFVTVNDPPVPLVTTPLPPVRAVLSERGFSRRVRETPDGPEVFVHDDATPGPAWQDVPGLVTRLGDVTELLTRTDDRWVAFKGGDAIRIAYDATRLPPLPAGWRRDYVLVSDGWDKDFDKNTVTGQSIEPFPFHAMSAYPYPESERHPDPRFLKEWLTRRSGPEAFHEALRGR